MPSTAPKLLKAPKVRIPTIAGLPKPGTALTETRLSAPEYILGLDMSLEHTGWCLFDVNTHSRHEGVLEPNPTKSKKVTPILGMKRLVWLRRRVTNLAMWGTVEPPEEQEHAKRISCLVMIEGYAFGAKGSSGINLGELGGVVRVMLYDLGIAYVEIPPTQAKKFLTGSGAAPKEIMLKEILKRYAFDTNDNNIADAYCLMEIGRAITSTNGDPLLAHQKIVTSDIVKTWLKDHPLPIAA